MLQISQFRHCIKSKHLELIHQGFCRQEASPVSHYPNISICYRGIKMSNEICSKKADEKMMDNNPVFGNTRLVAEQTAAVFTTVVLVTNTLAAVTTASLWTYNARHNSNCQVHAALHWQLWDPLSNLVWFE